MFQKISSIEKNLGIRRRVSRFSVGKFLCHVSEKHLGRNLLCLRKFLVPKIFSVVGVSRFCRSFLSHSTENFRRGPCVSEMFWYQNFLDNRSITILLIFFVSQYRKFS